MARFQTKLAELLEKQSERLPPHVSFSWRSLSAAVAISVQTLQEWHQASIGSEFYLERISSDVLSKLMNYFGVDKIDDLVVVVTSEEDSPHGFQEPALAALVAA